MKYRKLHHWKYQLIEPFEATVNIMPLDEIKTEFITLRQNGRLTLAQYYAWDGASGLCPDMRCMMRGTLIHDALYQLMRLNLISRRYRKAADQDLKKRILFDGANTLWAGIVYGGVRVFARKGVMPLAEEPIVEVP